MKEFQVYLGTFQQMKNTAMEEGNKNVTIGAAFQ